MPLSLAFAHCAFCSILPPSILSYLIIAAQLFLGNGTTRVSLARLQQSRDQDQDQIPQEQRRTRPFASHLGRWPVLKRVRVSRIVDPPSQTQCRADLLLTTLNHYSHSIPAPQQPLAIGTILRTLLPTGRVSSSSLLLLVQYGHFSVLQQPASPVAGTRSLPCLVPSLLVDRAAGQPAAPFFPPARAPARLG